MKNNYFLVLSFLLVLGVSFVTGLSPEREECERQAQEDKIANERSCHARSVALDRYEARGRACVEMAQNADRLCPEADDECRAVMYPLDHQQDCAEHEREEPPNMADCPENPREHYDTLHDTLAYCRTLDA